MDASELRSTYCRADPVAFSFLCFTAVIALSTERYPDLCCLFVTIG